MGIQNIELKIINNGEGISHAIDRKLDEDFKTNIKLNLTQWNTIFEIIKQDNATGTKQYRGEDSNISNGNHYQVSKGSYFVTQNAWTQICNFVNEIIKPKTSNTETSEENNTTKKANKDDNIKVKNLLATKNITNLDETTLNEVMQRYQLIKSGNDEIDALRLANFVKGKTALALENEKNQAIDDIYTKIAENPENLDDKVVIQALRSCAKAEQELNTTFKDENSYIQYSNAIMENSDANNDKVIDFSEYYKRDLILMYLNQGETIDNAAQKAMDYLKRFNDVPTLMKAIKNVDITNPNCTPEDFALYSSAMNYEKINQNEDMGIDSNELAAYYATVANYDGTADNNMTIADIYKYNSQLESGYLAEYSLETNLSNMPLPKGCKIEKRQNAQGKEIQAIIDSQGKTLELIDYYLKYYNEFFNNK